MQPKDTMTDSLLKTKNISSRTKKTTINNRNNILYLTAATCTLMFILNYMTLMLVDDYRYCFSFAENSIRISSPEQIIPSMQAHYYTMNGRLISHGLVQLILMLPPIVFDVLNASVFCLLCYLVYEYVWKLGNDSHNTLLFLVILASLWVFVPAFGQVFLWLDGSVNYLWPLAALLFYIRPAIRDWPLKNKPYFWVLYLMTGFIMGGLSETISFAVMGMFVFLMLYAALVDHKGLQLWRITPVFTMMPSYIYMVSAPGTRSSKISTDVRVAVRLIGTIKQYVAVLKWPLLLWVVMAVFVITLQGLTERIWQSSIWLLLSAGMNCMHGVTSYYPERSMIGVSVFLIIADGLLLSELFEKAHLPMQDLTSVLYKLLSNLVCTSVLLGAVILFLPGTYDIYSTWRQMQKNENYIINEVAAGDREVEINSVQTSTRYSGAHGLRYIDINNPDSWPNDSMARYYGADRIIGK